MKTKIITCFVLLCSLSFKSFSQIDIDLNTELVIDIEYTNNVYFATHSLGLFLVINGKENNAVGNNGKFKDPILFVPGIDFNFFPIINWDLNEIYEELNRDGLLEDLHNLGRDVIIVDLYDGDGYIQSNATAIADMLLHIKDNKVSTNSKTSVVGISMGGIVARYALTSMEYFELDHDVDLYLSFDSPHNGAFVPEGLMRFGDWITDNIMQIYISAEYDRIYNFLFKLKLPFTELIEDNSPAALQLIINPIDRPSASNDVGQQFWSDLESIGNFPNDNNLRSVAISNGRADGTFQTWNGESKLLEWNLTDDITGFKKFEAKVWREEGVEWRTHNEAIFFGDDNGFNTWGDYNQNEYYFPLGGGDKSYSNRLGSVQGANWDISCNQLNELITAFNSVIDDGSLNFPDLCDLRFTFIPTLSALGVEPTSSWNESIGSKDNVVSDNSLFDKLYASTLNTFHTEQTEEITEWLLRELGGVNKNRSFDYPYSYEYKTNSVVGKEININNYSGNSGDWKRFDGKNGITITNSSFSKGSDISFTSEDLIAKSAGGQGFRKSSSSQLVESTYEAGLERDEMENEIIAEKSSIYPNPANDYFTIILGNKSSMSIRIFSIEGKLLKFDISTSKFYRVDASDLETGIYFVVLSDENSRETLKLIIE